MTTVRDGFSPIYTGKFTWSSGVVSEDVHAKLNVDNAVHIDADHSDGVIRVIHDKSDGIDILEATDATTGCYHANRRQRRLSRRRGRGKRASDDAQVRHDQR